MELVEIYVFGIPVVSSVGPTLRTTGRLKMNEKHRINTEESPEDTIDSCESCRLSGRNIKMLFRRIRHKHTAAAAPID